MTSEVKYYCFFINNEYNVFCSKGSNDIDKLFKLFCNDVKIIIKNKKIKNIVQKFIEHKKTFCDDFIVTTCKKPQYNCLFTANFDTNLLLFGDRILCELLN